MAEPSRATVLAGLLECLKTTHLLADGDVRVLTSKLFSVIDEWKNTQQQRVDAEAHCLAVLKGLEPTGEELKPFQGVRSRLLQAIPVEVLVRRGTSKVEYKEIREDVVGTTTLASAVLTSGDDPILPLNTDEMVVQLAMGDTAPQVALVNAATHMAVGDAVPQFAKDDTATHVDPENTVVPSSMDQRAAPVVQDHFDGTNHRLAADNTVVPSNLDQNVTSLVEDNAVPTIARDGPRISSPLSVREKTPTPPSTPSLTLPLSPSGIIPPLQEPTNFAVPVPATEDVVGTQGGSSFVPTVPPTRDDAEIQGQDPDTDYDTTHLYAATPPRATRAPSAPAPTPAALDPSSDELALDDNTVPVMNLRTARAVATVNRRVTRASRAASHELLWGAINTNPGATPVQRAAPVKFPDTSNSPQQLLAAFKLTAQEASVQVVPPTPAAPSTGESSATQSQQLGTDGERPKKAKVHFERKATRSVTKSSTSQLQHSAANTAYERTKNAEDSPAPKPAEAAARPTTSSVQSSGSGTTTCRSQGAEVQLAPKVTKSVAKAKAKAKAQPQQPSTTTSSRRLRGIKGQPEQTTPKVVEKPTTSKAKKPAAENSAQESQGTVGKPAPQAPQVVAKSAAFQPEEPIANSSSRRPQVSGPATQLGATPKPVPKPEIPDTRTREMTTAEVKKGRYWVFEHGSTKRRVRLYVLRCPNKDCKNPVFSRHPFKQNRAAEHLRGCTSFRMENVTEDNIIARFAYNVRSDHSSGPVTREWACRHNSTLISKTRSCDDLRAENVWEEDEEEEEGDELAR